MYFNGDWLLLYSTENCCDPRGSYDNSYDTRCGGLQLLVVEILAMGGTEKKKTCTRSHQLATQQRIYLKGSNGRFRQRLSLSPLGFGSLCFSESTKLLHDRCKTDPIIGLLVSLHKPCCFFSISSLLVLLLCSGHLCEGAGVWCVPEGSPPRPALWEGRQQQY